MISQSFLLMLLGAGGLIFLLPYWSIKLNQFTLTNENTVIEVVQNDAPENLTTPTFEIIGYICNVNGVKTRKVEVFPWHSDNNFESLELATNTVNQLGFKEGHSCAPIYSVKMPWGAFKCVSVSYSINATKQLKRWSMVACCIFAMGLIILMAQWL